MRRGRPRRDKDGETRAARQQLLMMMDGDHYREWSPEERAELVRHGVITYRESVEEL